MESSGPDVPVSDPRPRDNASEKEQSQIESRLNGHANTDATQPEQQSAPKAVSLDQSSTTERPTDAKTDLATEADKPAVNGSYLPNEEVMLDKPAESLDKPVSKTEEEPRSLPGARVSAETPAAIAEESDKTASAFDEKKRIKSPDTATADQGSSANPVEEKSKIGASTDGLATRPTMDGTQDTIMTDAPTEKIDEAEKSLPTDEPTSTSQVATASSTHEVDLGPSSMSQLAIDSTEIASSPAQGSKDLLMADAPGVKGTREREDDFGEEPAPKRAKTEPKEDDATGAISAPSDVQAEVVVSGTESPGLTPTTLDKLANWLDEETNKRDISAFQRREIRKVIARVKKTKAGAHFRDSVQKLWPTLWDSYVDKVDHPMDLAEVERRLRDANGPYNTYGDFRSDLGLIFVNTLLFNGPLHDVTAAAVSAVKAVWEEVLPIPSEEPVKPKAVPKPKPVRESRAVANVDATRRQSAGPTASPAAEAPTHKPAVVAQDASADRRSSTATEGDRPKRTVRAPKPKDIDYTTKPSRKKLKPELQFAEEVLAEIMSPKNQQLNTWFLDPVDAEGLNIPTYYSVIKNPMDLNKVSRLLNDGQISNLKDFDKYVRLIFDNCYKFNGPVDQGNPVSALAKQLEDVYLAQMRGKDVWLAKHAKANAPASASNASDEEEEDEDEDGDVAGDVAVDNKAIAELQAKLDEETKKLNGMFVTANQSIIDIQKKHVEMIQKTLIEMAQEVKLARAKAKSDKPKKSGKSGKPKSGSSGGRKSTGGNAQPKKAGVSRKAAPKKSLTASEKDQIAHAINDLDGPHLDRAIDIIKRDTGQNENNDGELELDIDQLSNDALLKLWELCKKALPNFARDSAPVASPEVKHSAVGAAKSSAAKPKKHKPMSKAEQEERIERLKGISKMFNPGREPGDDTGLTPLTPGAESSDDSDSEEE